MPSTNTTYKPRHCGDFSSASHTGKWTVEEKAYADALAKEFEEGSLLAIDEGISLRRFLSQALNCSAKRISKKYEGSDYNGKMLYKKQKGSLATEEAEKRCNHLEDLESKYEESLKVLKMVEDSKQAHLSSPPQSEHSMTAEFMHSSGLKRFGLSSPHTVAPSLPSSIFSPTERLARLDAALAQATGRVSQEAPRNRIWDSFAGSSSNGSSGTRSNSKWVAESPLFDRSAFPSSPYLLQRAALSDASSSSILHNMMLQQQRSTAHRSLSQCGAYNLLAAAAERNLMPLKSGSNNDPSEESYKHHQQQRMAPTFQLRPQQAVLPVHIASLRVASSSNMEDAGLKKRAEQNQLLLNALMERNHMNSWSSSSTGKRKRHEEEFCGAMGVGPSEKSPTLFDLRGL